MCAPATPTSGDCTVASNVRQHEFHIYAPTACMSGLLAHLATPVPSTLHCQEARPSDHTATQRTSHAPQASHYHQPHGSRTKCRARNLSTPGVEPGLSRPQRDVLATRRCRPCKELQGTRVIFDQDVGEERGRRGCRTLFIASCAVGSLRPAVSPPSHPGNDMRAGKGSLHVIPLLWKAGRQL